MVAAYRNQPRPQKGDSGKQGVPLAVMAALLADRLDLATDLLSIRKTQSERRKQWELMKAIVKELTEQNRQGGGRIVITDPSLHRGLFEVFNAVRLPTEAASSQALGEFKLMQDNLLSTYLYAWLYLLYFVEPRQEAIGWPAMRTLITS